MRTIRLQQPKQFQLIETESPKAPAAGEAIVRVKHVGLCGTDIHAYRGNQPFFEYPRILGHELGVEIEELGKNCGSLIVGMRCSVEPYLSKPSDRAFARGKTNCSSTTKCMGVHVDGGMRERIIVPANKLHPSSLDTEKLALVEMLCIGYHAVKRASLEGNETVAVIGMGPIGLSVAQFLSTQFINFICVDISDTRLKNAVRMFPQATCVNSNGEGSLETKLTNLSLARPEVVFECTGNKHSMEASFALPDFGGKLVIVGIYNGALSFSNPDFHKRELTLISSRNAIGSDFKAVINALETDQFDVNRWINHHCTAQDFPDSIEMWLKPDSNLVKGVIEF